MYNNIRVQNLVWDNLILMKKKSTKNNNFGKYGFGDEFDINFEKLGKTANKEGVFKKNLKN